MTAPAPQQKPQPLPKLREELQIIPGKRDREGEQSWRIYDPVQHRFIEIDEMTFKILSLWQKSADVPSLIAALERSFDLKVQAEDISRLAEFIFANQLSSQPPGGDWRKLAERASKSKESTWQWLLHNYLFFKIPLFRPQRFLVTTLPLVAFLFNRWVHVAFGLAGLTGLYLASRQWDQFLNTFQYFFTMEGAAIFACALFGVKALHELGHAYTAIRLGCQVPSIGLAFMMMTPMLYTDVTDAWRLKSRRQRIAIDSAGIAVELMIACVALLAWNFLQPGPSRSLAFVLATSSLFMSLVINLSPFMRFDGYFILSDLVGIPNLQPRAFAVTRWHLREVLFGLGDRCPEDMSKPAIAGLIAYSWATWIYRLLLYFGIALVVYHYFFKLLGIFLFLVEIGFFIALPIYRELTEWNKVRGDISKSRRLPITGVAFGCLILLSIIPWSTQVNIPVVIEPGELARVFPVRNGVVETVKVQQGDWVEAGAVLVTMSSKELDRDIKYSELQLQKIRAQLARLTVDEADRDNRIILLGELATSTEKLKGLLAERAELDIKSPIEGRITELNPTLGPKSAWNARNLIAIISNDKGYVARGFVGENDIWRVAKGTPGRFVPDSIEREMYRLSVQDISPTGASVIDISDVASTYGGNVAVQPDAQKRLIPADARFAITLNVLGTPRRPDIRYRGVAQLSGASESFALSLLRQAYRVIVREAGA